MSTGFLSIVLHAHLPYVHHPEYEHFFEETWLFEAITECYLPLIAMLDRLQADQIDYRLTLSLSPTLLTMWASPLLQSRYLEHLQRQLALAEQEVRRTRGQAEYHRLAEMYQSLFRNALCSYRDHYQGDLTAAFVKHQQTGKLQLITTAATHGFLPLLNVSEIAVQRQLKAAIASFEAFTGNRPSGFWLPECGFYPGLEKLLRNEGIEYFYVDSHAVLNDQTLVATGIYAALDCGNGVAAFARDPASSRQVWSASEGYPGNADYREFHSDIGFELDLDYLAPYLQDADTRVNTGIKYHRVTGQAEKQLYEPQQALAKALLHAQDFVQQKQRQVDVLAAEMDTPPLIVAPYDAELFGHWWFEGPNWLESVLRLTSDARQGLKTLSCREYLDMNLPRQKNMPLASSWGEHGYSAYWLNESNEWIYPLIHKAAFEMDKLSADLKKLSLTELQHRALNQASRALLLAQASDWPFIIKTGTSVDYAKKRIMDHLARFNYLHDAIRKNRINERYLAALEVMDDIFPELDFRELT